MIIVAVVLGVVVSAVLGYYYINELQRAWKCSS